MDNHHLRLCVIALLIPMLLVGVLLIRDSKAKPYPKTFGRPYGAPDNVQSFENGADELDQRRRASRRAIRSTCIQATAPYTWYTQFADNPPGPLDVSAGGLQLDGDDHPHVAYGGDRLYYAWHDGDTWQVEVVDANSGVGEHASLALEATAPYTPHISYYDSSAGMLRYAKLAQAGWNIEIVDATRGAGRWSSIALDTNGRPHISYTGYNETDHEDLNYACWLPSGWHTETVDSRGQVGWHTSLDLDNSGYPHISYFDATNQGLKYAHWSGTDWITETVHSVGNGGGKASGETSLELDASDNPHIAYANLAHGQLEYYVLTDTAWFSQTLVAHGWSPSLALDEAGNTHIAYTYSGHLVYAHSTGLTWVTDTVSVESISGVSLALDSNNQPCISYYTWETDELDYAQGSGTEWDIQTVHEAKDVGRFNSLALDGAGHPHVAYIDATDSALRYAHWSGVDWFSETVDSAEYWSGLSLAMGEDGAPHIAYHSQSELRYAYRPGYAWLIKTVDVEGDRGASIALDREGRPHISYYGYGLQYAYFNGESWDVQTISREVDGYFTSIALDEQRHPHISYYSVRSWSDPRELRYAHWAGDAWITKTVDIDTEYDNWNQGHSSLALDLAGTPHISYRYHYGDLKYATRTASGWSTQVIGVIDGLGIGPYTSLTFSVLGRPHISCSSGPGIRLVYWNGSTWSVQTADSGIDRWTCSSLGLDKSGRPHISYYDYDNWALKYAWRNPVIIHRVYLPSVLRSP